MSSAFSSVSVLSGQSSLAEQRRSVDRLPSARPIIAEPPLPEPYSPCEALITYLSFFMPVIPFPLFLYQNKHFDH
ncbi:hypothetical protein TYRP_005286, partial [Tyrophagus putrescentiae]